jgi:hypothetical protein
VGREANPRAAILDAQSAKGAQKEGGKPSSSPMTIMLLIIALQTVNFRLIRRGMRGKEVKGRKRRILGKYDSAEVKT